MTDPDRSADPSDHEQTDGPPDPGLNPMASPGLGVDVEELSDIEVSRDVTLGEATPAEMMAADTEPVADDEVAALLDDLQHGDVPQRRRAALELADRERTERTVAALATAAVHDDDADVRQFAVEALGKLGGDLARRIGTVAVDDPDPWVRSEAYVALDRLDREAFADTIAEGLDDDHHAIRRNAAVSLFKLYGEDAEDLLLDLADDPSERVREWAAHMLGGVDSDAARETLEGMATTDDAEVVRETAANALDADPVQFRRQFRGTTASRTLSEDPINEPREL